MGKSKTFGAMVAIVFFCIVGIASLLFVRFVIVECDNAPESVLADPHNICYDVDVFCKVKCRENGDTYEKGNYDELSCFCDNGRWFRLQGSEIYVGRTGNETSDIVINEYP
jgi:hypothetical protein